jgi:hypothetical protein
MPFGHYLLGSVREALAAIPAVDAPDIYAIFFFIYDEGDDPYKPTVTIGYNTESQVKRVLDHAGRRHPDLAEARWNYAYWLQNELAVIGDSKRDPEGSAKLIQWITDNPELRDHPETNLDPNRQHLRPSRPLHPRGQTDRTRNRPLGAGPDPRTPVRRSDRQATSCEPVRRCRRFHRLGPQSVGG